MRHLAHTRLTGAGELVYDGLAEFRAPAAAILHQKGEQTAQPLHIGKVTNASPFALAANKARTCQDREVGRHRILPHPQGFADIACRHPPFSGCDEKTEDIKAGDLTKRRKSVESVILIHISGIIDSFDAGQALISNPLRLRETMGNLRAPSQAQGTRGRGVNMARRPRVISIT
jgi:hypothetical protein